jgi:hypothetical protein
MPPNVAATPNQIRHPPPRAPPTTALLQSMFMRWLATAAEWPHAEESSFPDSRRGIFFLVIFGPLT